MVRNKNSKLNLVVFFKGRWAVNPYEAFLHTIMRWFSILGTMTMKRNRF